MSTMTVHKDLIDSLVDHDEYELPDGRLLRLAEEPDPFTDIRDYADCYGRVEYIRPGHHQNERPDGFNGAARKLWAGGDCYWWQPPADLVGDPDSLRKTRQAVCDLIRYGTSQLRVELCEGKDAYGDWIVCDYAVIGGIEYSTDYSYKADYVADLVAELGVI